MDQPLKFYKIALATLLFISLMLHGRMLWFQWYHVASGSGDFVAYYTAGKILCSGNIRDLSSFESQEKAQKQLALPSQKIFVPFYHAPYQALLFAPIAQFPYPTARLIWALLNLVFLFIILAVLVDSLDSTHQLLDGLILIATYPTWINFMQGHDAILSALILVAAFGCLKNQRDRLAGSILALVLYKPQLVLPIAAIALYNRQWRIASTFVIAGFFLVCLSVLMLSWEGSLDLIGSVVSNLVRGNLERASHMINTRALLITFLGSSLIASVMTVIASVALLCGCALLCKDGFGSAGFLIDLKFSLALVTTLLINPHSHPYEFVVLLVALIILLDYVLKVEPKMRFFRETIVIVLFIICIPIIPNVLMSYDLIPLYALPVLVLYCFIGLEIRQWQRCEAKLYSLLLFACVALIASRSSLLNRS